MLWPSKILQLHWELEVAGRESDSLPVCSNSGVGLDLQQGDQKEVLRRGEANTGWRRACELHRQCYSPYLASVFIF